MVMTASKLRQDIYKILDEILESGNPLEIKRRGRILRIVPEKPVSKFDNLVKRSILNVDPEDIIHIDWSSEWRP
ncbi:type II toxin-antitoxin system Phd/YefM family antitoxin [bacterium]|nr:type II toxin-antitoxin system Phd/YefM family antitoxin [bacterium]